MLTYASGGKISQKIYFAGLYIVEIVSPVFRVPFHLKIRFPSSTWRVAAPSEIVLLVNLIFPSVTVTTPLKGRPLLTPAYVPSSLMVILLLKFR